MRTQTAREKAEAHVALIRARYPNPVSFAVLPDWEDYCVVVAAFNYSDMTGGIARTVLGDNRKVVDLIASLNDAGRFEEAWLALTDCAERTPIWCNDTSVRGDEK